MILFAADNHYDTHAGRALFECIKTHYEISFHEDDWACFDRDNLADRYALIVLNMISGSCKVPMPAPSAEENVLSYLRSGGSLLLLHGASAAFWQWSWWRAITGFRWVRRKDPDGFAASSHPVVPYDVEISKSRHPLCRRLQAISIPKDELYIDLEQSCAAVTLMETRFEGRSFPMCYETTTGWGGGIAGYIPGHASHVVRLPGNVANCRALIDWLLSGRAQQEV